ncbi:SUR7/PalI family domain containing protein [Rhypophila decipiens]
MGKRIDLPSFLRIRKSNSKTVPISEKRSPTLSSGTTWNRPDGVIATRPESDRASSTSRTASSDTVVTLNEASIKQRTKLRRNFAISGSISYALSVIFLILVIIGNTSNSPVLKDVYFYKLDLTDIIPTSVPNAQLINSIAQSIGLHDFYQVGLWNFCEGYQGQGITFCSTPEKLYWFNPVEVIMNELLAGATIALPTAVITILDVLRITSQIMFGFFITGIVINFIMIFVTPLGVDSRWRSLPLGIVSFISSFLIVGASIVGTVISIAFRIAATAQSDLNIHAEVGTRMFVFMWLASAFTLWGFIVHAGMGCCCVSRRDLRTGRRQINRSVVMLE